MTNRFKTQPHSGGRRDLWSSGENAGAEGLSPKSDGRQGHNNQAGARSMNARDVMTKAVVSVHPDTPVREIARLLLDNGISAVPVVDNNAIPIGIVSEGDLIRRDQPAREARREWWLEILAEGEQLSPEFLAW